MATRFTQLYQTSVVVLLLAGSVARADAEDCLLLGSHPEDGSHEVHVSNSLHLRFSQAMDAATLHHLRLVEQRGERECVEVAVECSTDLTQASVTVSPRRFLTPNAKYVLTGSSRVRSRAGHALQPFRLEFQTGDAPADPGSRYLFSATKVEAIRSLTTVLIGPDRRLYAADAFGNLYRWNLTEAGVPVQRELIWHDPRRSRQIVDLEWDPDAHAKRLVLWISYGERLPPDPERRFFTGTISRLTIGDRVREEQMVIGLPHGREKQGGFDTLPHQPNGLVFRNGLLYQSIGSTSSSGGPANWGIAEQPLSACVIEIDVKRIEPPLDVHPDAKYDATADYAALRVFATGIRNALELVLHPNGNLYTGVNQNDRRGRADGVPDHPGLEGDQNHLITSTTPDHESLLLVRRGRHYGFPNPSRGHYVLSGGNPTTRPDPFEISDYPVGTPPDGNFAAELMFPIWQYGGTSPNGGIAYHRPGHPLHEHLIWCFYSTGGIAVMPLAGDGLPAGVEMLRTPSGKLLLSGPLDITQDEQTGNLYIADFGKQNKFGADGSLVLLRPERQAIEQSKR